MSTARQQNPAGHSLSIVIPAFNEAATIRQILEKIIQVSLDREFEIVVINDGSTDDTHYQVQAFKKAHPQIPLTYVNQDNQGKGGAVKTGIMAAKNEVILVQDADLEYDPNDYPALLAEIDRGEMVVYGSRNLQRRTDNHSSRLFYWGGLLVTWVTNLLYGSKLTDAPTCYKVFRKSLFNKLDFFHKDFGWEPEITAKILKNNITIKEVPISYDPRTKAEGKKISWRDGVIAIWILLNERFKE